MTDVQNGRWLLLAAGTATFVLMGAVQALYGPALPVLARETGSTTAAVSLIFSVHWMGSAGGVATMFALGPRITPRIVLALLAAGPALLGSGLGWGVMLAGAVLSGLGQGCAAVLFNPRLLAAFGPRGPAMLSLINAAFGAGAIVAPLVLVELQGDFRPMFLMLAVAFLAVLIGAQNKGGVAASATLPRGFRPDWQILCLGAFAIGFEAALIGLGPAALVRAGVSETAAAEAQSGFFAAYLAARLALTFVANRVSPFTLFVASLASVALATGAATVLPPYWCFVAAGVGAGAVFPGYFVEAVSRMGHDPRVSPLIIAGGLVGGIGLPFTLARLDESLGPRGFFVMMAALATAVTLVALAGLLAGALRTGRRGA